MAAKFEVYRDGKGEYRWRLRTSNGSVIATGGEGSDSSTIRACCASPARTLGERINRSSSTRSPSRSANAGAGRFATPHRPTL